MTSTHAHTPQATDAPQTDHDIVSIVADASATATPLRIVGSGVWLDAGRPVHAERALSMRNYSGIVEYVPGDLVLTVRAGTSLAEIAHATAEYGQWLSLDPIGPDTGTIGATIATASSGPLALGAGTVRDLVLGLGLVSGTGAQLRVGGRVVKNVAGFDLVRLSIGAFGTLGVLTDISVRLHAKPAADHTYVVALPGHDPDVILRSLGLRALSFQALEVLDAATAARINVGDGSPWTAVVRVMGNAARVHAQRAALSSLGAIVEVHASVWRVMRDEDAATAVVRVTAAPSALTDTVTRVANALATANCTGAQLRVTPHRGSVRVCIPDTINGSASTQGAVALLVTTLRAHVTQGSVIGERLPPSAWEPLRPNAPDPIAERIRDAFDPHRVLNRGILGEYVA